MARDAIKISKSLDDNSITNRIDVNISDGVESLLINTDGSLNAVVSATNLDIRNLSEATDQVLIFANTAKDGTGTDYVPLVDIDGHLQVDVLSGATGGTEYVEDAIAPAAATGRAVLAERDDILSAIIPIEGDWTKLYANARGALWVELDPTNAVTIQDGGNIITVDGTVAATQSGVWNIGTVTTLTGITNDVNIADGGNIISVDDAGGSLTVDGTVSISGTVTVTATDLDIRALDHVTIGDSVRVGDGVEILAINADGSINVVTQPSAGSPINSFSQAAALASAASSNHDYTAAGGTFEPIEVSVSSTSLGTFEILLNLSTVGYLRTSVEEPNAHFKFTEGTNIADTQVVRVVRTNDSNKAHSFESTIKGYQN